MRRSPTDPAADVGNKHPMAEGRGAEHDLPVISGRIQVVGDANDPAAMVDRVLDEVVLQPRIPVDARQVLGDD